MNPIFDLTWLVPLPPAVACALIILVTNRNKSLSSAIAIAGVVVSLIIGWAVAFSAFVDHDLAHHPVNETLFSIPTGWTDIDIGYALDPANALMLFMVPFLLVMIFIYARGYMTFPHHLKAADFPRPMRKARIPATVASWPTSRCLPWACWGW